MPRRVRLDEDKIGDIDLVDLLAGLLSNFGYGRG